MATQVIAPETTEVTKPTRKRAIVSCDCLSELPPPNDSAVESKDLLTPAEVAAKLRCSKGHVSHLVNGLVPGLPPLPVVRIGRRVLIRRETLDYWMTVIETSARITEDLNSSRVMSEKD